MKIVIITEQPMDSLCGMEEFRRRLAREKNGEVTCLPYAFGEKRDIVGEIRALQPDLLITADLPGFEQCTLTDNVSYNLLDCRQLHLLLHENLRNEAYLGRQLSIAMFFYCAGEAYCDYLMRKYPNLPYLKSLNSAAGRHSADGQKDADAQNRADRQNHADAQNSVKIQNNADFREENRNAENFYAAFQEVLQECGIPI